MESTVLDYDLKMNLFLYYVPFIEERHFLKYDVLSSLKIIIIFRKIAQNDLKNRDEIILIYYHNLQT